MPRKKCKGSKKDFANDVCVFCGDNTDDEQAYGKKLSKSGVTVHYFCMLFASGLCQCGKTDNDGLLGFLPRDILKEVNRGKRLKCSFCKKVGATIGCATSSCRLKYHFGCGLHQETVYQFFGSYSSFCQEHRPRQAPPVRERLSFKGAAKTSCSICMSSVTARASNNTLRSPCCKNSWFHRSCIQAMANSSGLHFFKCPLCNNKELFQEEMLTFGIYIPDQDAAWELEPNAYEDLLERPNECSVDECVCPNGKEHNKLGSMWELMSCDWCGSKATHLKCSDLINPMDDWSCTECISVIGNAKPKRPKSQESKTYPENFLKDKFRKAKKRQSPTKQTKRKWNELSDDECHISSHKKRKKRKLTYPSKKSKLQLSRTCKNKSNKTISSLSIEQNSEDEKLTKFLESSPWSTNADSDIEFNISQDSLKSLSSLITKKSKRSKKRFKKRLDLTVKNGNGNRCVKTNKENLQKPISVSQNLHVTNGNDKPNKNRETMRSQKAVESAMEIKNLDKINLPKWVQKMHEEDIITGKNLGEQFIRASPTNCKLFEVTKSTKAPPKISVAEKGNIGENRFIEQLTPRRNTGRSNLASREVIDPSFATEVNEVTKSQELKQLLMTDFIAGKNLGCQFAAQSPTSKLNSPDKIKIQKYKPKAKKSLSLGSDLHLSSDDKSKKTLCTEEKKKHTSSKSGILKISKSLLFDENDGGISGIKESPRCKEVNKRSPLLSLSPNCERASPSFRKVAFSRKFQLLNTEDENEPCSLQETQTCDIGNNLRKPSPNDSIYEICIEESNYDINANVSPGRGKKNFGDNVLANRLMKNSFDNPTKQLLTSSPYRCNDVVESSSKSSSKSQYHCSYCADLQNLHKAIETREQHYSSECDQSNTDSSVMIIDSDSEEMKQTAKLPIHVDLGYDLETMSCDPFLDEEDSVCITSVIPSFQEFVRKNFDLQKDDSLDLESESNSESIPEDKSIIVLDSTTQEDHISRYSIDSSKHTIVSINSSNSTSFLCNTHNKSVGSQADSIYDESPYYSTREMPTKNSMGGNNTNLRKKTEVFHQNIRKISPVKTSGPSSFVMLGEVKHSQMCTIS